MKKICPRCKGKGAYWTKLKQGKSTPWRFSTNDNLPIDAYVTCEMPGCHNGTLDIEENRRITAG